MRIRCHAIRLTPGACRYPGLQVWNIEDRTGVGDQAPVSVNVPGSSNSNNSKKFVQQAFHPGLLTRPRSASLGSKQGTKPSHASNERPPIIDLDIEDTVSGSSRLENSDDNHQNHSSPQPEWSQVSSRKRQRNSPDGTTSTQKQSKPNYWLAVPTPVYNRFSELENDPASGEIQVTKPIKPPPIFVDKVSNIQPLTKMLEEKNPRRFWD